MNVFRVATEGVTTSIYLSTHQTIYLNWVYFIACKSYLNKVDLKVCIHTHTHAPLYIHIYDMMIIVTRKARRV